MRQREADVTGRTHVTERSGVQRHRQNELRKSIGTAAKRARACATTCRRSTGQTQRITTLEPRHLEPARFCVARSVCRGIRLGAFFDSGRDQTFDNGVEVPLAVSTTTRHSCALHPAEVSFLSQLFATSSTMITPPATPTDCSS